jgi:transketolase
MANAIRFLAMDAVQAANSGHPGMPMGMADVATVLFNRFIKHRSVDAGLGRPRPLRAVGRATARCCSTRSIISSAIPT